MGSCVSKGSTASSPQHYAVQYTEQATPSPSSSEASMSPSRHGSTALESPIARWSGARRSVLLPHEVQQAAYQLAMRLNGRPIDASDRQRLADATSTVHETRLALHRGRGNVDSDLRLSNGRSATYSSLSYCLGEDDENLLAGSALAAGAGNCDHNAAINTRRHAVRMEDGGQMMTVRDYEQTHLYALYQPPNSAEADGSTVVLDSWGDGPAVLLRDSHWAESYGTSTHVIERFDKPDATDALARTNAFRAEIENPQTALHANARELETAFLANPAPGDIFSAMPVIAPDLAESTRRRLQEYSPRTRNVLAADAARDAYGLDDAQANSPRTTKAILKEAKRLDALGRPPLSW
ncbi:XopE/AvrPphe family type III secretion system effector [Pseudomonas amygdali]|uniref:Avirulence protein n=1 Tax=Pseudomonas amygdali pv. photiniae TaxID=251724 RepID=A0A0P9UAB7_PSEA0|nr:XopE/AvrPphe family type III secretion system effector [Pseudomonas amygdali]KPX74686.1 Avirulence protein [Pseudomonas amygdali pv. photiniae]